MLMSIEIEVNFFATLRLNRSPKLNNFETSSPTYLDYDSPFEFEINTNLHWPKKGPIFDHLEEIM